jgi:methionyl-tRNA synthetase
MGYVKKIENLRVVVEPRGAGDFGFASISGMKRTLEEEMAICEDIIQQIKRHVDDIGSVYLERDSELVCEHCGAYWTEGSASKHNGGCCSKDCEVYIKENGE